MECDWFMYHLRSKFNYKNCLEFPFNDQWSLQLNLYHYYDKMNPFHVEKYMNMYFYIRS